MPFGVAYHGTLKCMVRQNCEVQVATVLFPWCVGELWKPVRRCILRGFPVQECVEGLYKGVLQ